MITTCLPSTDLFFIRSCLDLRPLNNHDNLVWFVDSFLVLFVVVVLLSFFVCLFVCCSVSCQSNAKNQPILTS